MNQFRVALIVQRYGEDVNGGSEQLCRAVAERLAQHCSCDVITTCAKDYITWQNEFPPGETIVSGVRVLRFLVDTPRDIEAFGRLSADIYARKNSMSREIEWMKAQGPYSGPLLRYIRDYREAYDAFIFFTYLYCTTYFGLPLVSDRAILVPTAHDEPPIYLSIFDDLFRLPQRFLFLTPEERDFVLKRFCLPDGVGEVGGFGLEDAAGDSTDAYSTDEPAGTDPYILYLGRIDEGKGCRTLVDWFDRFTADCPEFNLRLVLAGKAVMPIPANPRIIAPGFVSETAKASLIRNSLFMIAPSPYESLCISALEAWLHGKAVLANGECLVLAGQCRRSQGGLWYRNYEEFEECISLLARNDGLRKQLGAAGRRFVTQEYGWDRVERTYLRNITMVAAGRDTSEQSLAWHS